MDREEEPHYGLVDDGREYGSVIQFQHSGQGLYAIRLQPNLMTRSCDELKSTLCLGSL